ncbi:MAG TPA: hypothetical protein VGJ77_22200 [Gaiellaceae bacterium]
MVRGLIGATVLAAAAALAGAGHAHAASKRPAPARPDVAVTAVDAPRSVTAGTPFQVDVTLRERSGRAPAQAVVSVSGAAEPASAPAVRVAPGGQKHVLLSVTVPTAGTSTIMVRAGVARDAAAANNAATRIVAATDFVLWSTRVLVDSFAGYGAQFNQNVYSALSRAAGVDDANVGDMEGKVTALGPQFVRLFFHRSAFWDADRMQSFVRAAQLAQRAGATIDVTWQTSAGSDLDVEITRFGHLLSDLVLNRGVTNLRWATLQNEVNSTRVSMETYDHLYRVLDAALAVDGVRDRIRFMGGDLVAQPSPLGQTQNDWLRFLGARMSDILDAYSIHVYWDFWSPEKIERRLTEVRQIVDALPAEQRRPLYITEFGARGHRDPGDAGPGTFDGGAPLGNTNANAFQHAWLDVLAPRLGFAGAVKWDAYFGRYDAKPQAYTMIGPPQEGWPLRPVYNLTRLFTATTRPGWKAVAVDGAKGPRLVTAFAGPQGELTLVGLDTQGALLNTTSATVSTYTIGGLPPAATFRLQLWNADGTGTLAAPLAVTSDASGVIRIGAPLQCVFALTTLPL